MEMKKELSKNWDAWQSAKRLLCVRLDSLGDVLMTTPAMRALKRLPAGPELTLMTSSGGSGIAHLIPEIDHVLQADVAWLKHTPARTDATMERDLIDRLRAGNFDGCVIFTVLTQNPLPSALLCYLAEIPLRLAHSRENPYQLLTDWVADTETLASARHEVTRQLDLVAHVGATTEDCRLSLRISSSVQYATERWLERHELSPRGSWCILHPGASAASRMYPAESYAQVAEQLARLGWRVVVTGSLKEAGLAECISRTCPQAINLAGCLDVEQLASLIAHCPVLICGNTGPAHLAAATGTPVVDLYALTNPQHTPWLGPSRVLNVDVPCRNCLKSVCPEGHHHCLRLVRPEQIVQAAIELTEACSRRADIPPRSSLCIR